MKIFQNNQKLENSIHQPTNVKKNSSYSDRCVFVAIVFAIVYIGVFLLWVVPSIIIPFGLYAGSPGTSLHKMELLLIGILAFFAYEWITIFIAIIKRFKLIYSIFAFIPIVVVLVLFVGFIIMPPTLKYLIQEMLFY